MHRTIKQLRKHYHTTQRGKTMHPRMNDILQLIRYSDEIEIMIRKDIIHGQLECFKEQREAYNKLLKDNELFIFEEDYIKNDKIPFLKLTIAMRQDK